MKKYLFNITSTAVIDADTEEEAKEKLEDIIADKDMAFNEDAQVLDDILTGAQVGQVVETLCVFYECPSCKHTECWEAEDFATKGEPVCPKDDNDMGRV